MQKNVIEYLEKTANLYPNKIAVKDANGTICFRDLFAMAQVVATAINAYNSKNQPIGVYMPKSGNMIASFAGINMSCNFYVPLDTKSPTERVQAILNVLDCNMVITNRANMGALSAFWQKDVLVFEDVIEQIAYDDMWRTKLKSQIDTDPVYSIFTSGSTGTPKGVVISHRGVIDFIDWACDTFKIDSSFVIGNQAPFYFDNSTMDIYLMYATGATLCIIPEDKFMFPAKLVDYLNENQISHIFWVPFVLVNVANMNILETKKPQYLRNIFFAGEVMPTKHLNYWRKYLRDCKYVNMYGPTEITDICTYYIVNREFLDTDPLPIGKGCTNTDILILVDRKREAQQNEQGELCVRGTSLAMGYYNDLAKTQQAFIQNPLNTHYPETIYCTGDIVYKNEQDEIMYIGRKDSQIKHNGYRIELGEIENAILSSGIIKHGCVVYDFKNKKIVLYYQSERDLNMGEFRKVVSTKIPRYMLPSEFHREEKLKQNGSGKIDRAYYNKQINI